MSLLFGEAMQYNIIFDIAAVMLNIMLILIIQLRRSYPTVNSFLYKAMLWLNLLSAVFDILSAYSISYPERFDGLFFLYFFGIAYLVCHNMTTVAFLMYVIVLVKGSFGTVLDKIYLIAMSAYFAIGIPFTPLARHIFYFDAEKNYIHGPLMISVYLVSFSGMIYALVLFIKHRKQMNPFQTATNVTFLTLLMGAVILQSEYPTFLIETFCAALAFMIMNVALDNPAIYFYRNTYCFNLTAFNTTLNKKLKQDNPFAIVALTYNDIAVFRKKFGDANYDKLIEKTIGKLHAMFGQRSVYLLSDDIFAIDIGNANEEPIMRSISQTLEEEFTVDGTPVRLYPHYAIVRYPGYADSAGDVVDSVNCMLYDVYPVTGERVIYASSEVLAAKHREEQVLHILRMAMQNDGFEVYYQPIFEQKTGKYISAEALVRLKKRADDEYIGPDEFIPIAENNGMILELGEVVLDKVCRFCRANELGKYGLKYVEVNLSMLQLVERESVERLDEICKRSGVEPSRINFEITESVTVDAGKRSTIKANIDYLREKGYSFSLDDYGSGYSTAMYLAAMPFTIVKLDKGVLWNGMRRDAYRTVLNNLVRLVHECGKICVVEGVENDEMADVLRALDVDFFQGYLYSRPIPGDEFAEFIKTRPNNL